MTIKMDRRKNLLLEKMTYADGGRSGAFSSAYANILAVYRGIESGEAVRRIPWDVADIFACLHEYQSQTPCCRSFVRQIFVPPIVFHRWGYCGRATQVRRRTKGLDSWQSSAGVSVHSQNLVITRSEKNVISTYTSMAELYA